MPYRLLIFDFDGTLADTFPAFLDHMRQTSEHFRLPTLDASLLEELRVLGAREIIQRLGIPVWKVPLVARYMRRLMAEDPRQIHLFPGISEMLATLHSAGHTLAIVSSNSETNIRTILGPERSALITAFACGASLFGKAARFRQVLKRTRTIAGEALAIGDEIRDIEAAREAGLPFGAVSWGYTKPQALRTHSPQFLFERVQEILEIASSTGK